MAAVGGLFDGDGLGDQLAADDRADLEAPGLLDPDGELRAVLAEAHPRPLALVLVAGPLEVAPLCRDRLLATLDLADHGHDRRVAGLEGAGRAGLLDLLGRVELRRAGRAVDLDPDPLGLDVAEVVVHVDGELADVLLPADRRVDLVVAGPLVAEQDLGARVVAALPAERLDVAGLVGVLEPQLTRADALDLRGSRLLRDELHDRRGPGLFGAFRLARREHRSGDEAADGSGDSGGDVDVLLHGAGDLRRITMATMLAIS